MTRDDIIKWAQEAQLPYYFPTSGELAYSNELMRFAELVVAAHPMFVNYEWFGLDENGLRCIVRQREDSELSQVSITALKENF